MYGIEVIFKRKSHVYDTKEPVSAYAVWSARTTKETLTNWQRLVDGSEDMAQHHAHHEKK